MVAGIRRASAMAAAALGFVAASMACGIGQGGADSERGPAPGAQDRTPSLTGQVQVVGSTPTERVVLRPEGEPGGIEIRGPLRPELRAVAGAIVRIWGERGAGDAIEVTDYRILEVAGRRPAVGVVHPIEGGIALRRSGGEVRIYDPPAELERLEGARIWVNLDASGGVLAYGVIRQP